VPPVGLSDWQNTTRFVVCHFFLELQAFHTLHQPSWHIYAHIVSSINTYPTDILLGRTLCTWSLSLIRDLDSGCLWWIMGWAAALANWRGAWWQGCVHGCQFPQAYWALLTSLQIPHWHTWIRGWIDLCKCKTFDLGQSFWASNVAVWWHFWVVPRQRVVKYVVSWDG
jgi:hypothetical protein